MDLFKDEKMLVRNGGFKSAFKWSLVAFPVILVLNLAGLGIITANFWAGVFALAVVSNAALAFICYLALKKGIHMFGLKNYLLRLDYICIILFFLLAYTFLIQLVLTGKLGFPRVGFPPLLIALLLPYFVKQ